MAKILYRTSITPIEPTEVSAGSASKSSPLSYNDLDWNFNTLDSDIQLRALIASPTFTGTVTTPELTAGIIRGQGAGITGLDAANISTGIVSAERGAVAGANYTSFVAYAGMDKTVGSFYGGTTVPTSSIRLNYDGHFFATKFIGDGSSLTGIPQEGSITLPVGPVNIGAYSAVAYSATGKLIAANCVDINHIGKVVGICISAVTANSTTIVRTAHTVENVAWNWQPGSVFVGENGQLTQSPSTFSAFKQVIGRVLSPTIIKIDILPPIKTGN